MNGIDVCDWLKGKRETEKDRTVQRHDCSSNTRFGKRQLVSRLLGSLLKGSGKYNKKTLNKKQNKIIVLGDSHTRGCAEAVRHNLGQIRTRIEVHSWDSKTGSKHRNNSKYIN